MLTSVSQAVAEVIAESHGEHLRAILGLAVDHLEEGEKLQAFELGENRVPFLLRIIPFVPRSLTAPTEFILGLTSRRLLIIRVNRTWMTRRVNGSTVAASIPFEQIESVTPRMGLLTSSLTIRTTSGQTLKYTDMLKSAADRFARAVNLAKQP